MGHAYNFNGKAVDETMLKEAKEYTNIAGQVQLWMMILMLRGRKSDGIEPIPDQYGEAREAIRKYLISRESTGERIS